MPITLAAPNWAWSILIAKLVFSANMIVVTTIPLALTVALNCFILVFSVQRLVAGRLYYYRLNPLRKLALAVSI